MILSCFTQSLQRWRGERKEKFDLEEVI